MTEPSYQVVNIYILFLSLFKDIELRGRSMFLLSRVYTGMERIHVGKVKVSLKYEVEIRCEEWTDKPVSSPRVSGE